MLIYHFRTTCARYIVLVVDCMADSLVVCVSEHERHLSQHIVRPDKPHPSATPGLTPLPQYKLVLLLERARQEHRYARYISPTDLLTARRGPADGWDIYRSSQVTITDSTINNGDDCVCASPPPMVLARF